VYVRRVCSGVLAISGEDAPTAGAGKANIKLSGITTDEGLNLHEQGTVTTISYLFYTHMWFNSQHISGDCGGLGIGFPGGGTRDATFDLAKGECGWHWRIQLMGGTGCSCERKYKDTGHTERRIRKTERKQPPVAITDPDYQYWY